MRYASDDTMLYQDGLYFYGGYDDLTKVCVSVYNKEYTIHYGNGFSRKTADSNLVGNIVEDLVYIGKYAE